MTQNADSVGAWWREHPAYADLMDSFAGCNNKPHLAFLALVGLRQRGWDVSPNGSSGAGQ